MYRVLVADPPWMMRDSLGKRGAAANYPVLDISDICRFPLPPMLNDSYLFLWRLASMQREALDVCAAWGFTPKTEIVWRKLTKTGKAWFGMGHHVRASHESCIVATIGNPKPAVRNIRSVFAAAVGRHSAKPDLFYEIVEQFSPGPYAELFARRTRPNWSTWGNELTEAHP